MKFLYDFKCKACNMMQEELTSTDTRTILCDCGSQMDRVISPVRSKLEGVSGDFPSAAMRWDRQHIQGAKNG